MHKYIILYHTDTVYDGRDQWLNVYNSVIDKSDMMLAVIETQRDNDNIEEESHCRLYEVGSIKTDEELVSYNSIRLICIAIDVYLYYYC